MMSSTNKRIEVLRVRMQPERRITTPSDIRGNNQFRIPSLLLTVKFW